MKDQIGKNTKDYYQIESKKYDLKRFKSPVGKYIDDVEKKMIIKNMKDGNVLELCCGTGRFGSIMTKRGHEYYGIDFTDNMLDKARAKNKGNKNVHLKLVDVKDLGKKMLHDNFDNIFVARAIKFWQDPAQVISDSYKLLKKDGRAIFCFQAKDKSLSGLIMGLNQKTQDKIPTLRSYRVGTERYYHSKQIEKMMRKAGFENIKKQHYFNFFGYTVLIRKTGRIMQKIAAACFRIFDNHLPFGWRTVLIGEKR